jgi:hypothetical protein
MAHSNNLQVALYACAVTSFIAAGVDARADSAADTQEELRLLKEQNRTLQDQLSQQKALIESLNQTVSEIQNGRTSYDKQLLDLKAQMEEASGSTPPKGSSVFSPSQVSISAEGAAGYFQSGSQGNYPDGDFRLDELKLFLESPVWKEVYFFTEINLASYESSDLNLKLGEAYIDFENVSRLWHQDRMLNFRIGRLDIPFGEEYIYRDAIDNPLISRSLSDIWGVDAGVEAYGAVGSVNYVVAVQNGGDGSRDFTSDKSVAGRLSYDPAKWLHLSASGMRTGNLDPSDLWSALYFANGWFVPLGGTNTTQFHANLVEGDVELRFPRGHVKAFGGYVHYNDNDHVDNNERDMYYYSVEGLLSATRRIYGVARFSQILVHNGYPLVGNGNMSEFLFGPLTKDLWRLSLGLGYRFSPNLVFKGEYSFERGRETNGDSRDHEDLFAVEAAFKF